MKNLKIGNIGQIVNHPGGVVNVGEIYGDVITNITREFAVKPDKNTLMEQRLVELAEDLRKHAPAITEPVEAARLSRTSRPSARAPVRIARSSNATWINPNRDRRRYQTLTPAPFFTAVARRILCGLG